LLAKHVPEEPEEQTAQTQKLRALVQQQRRARARDRAVRAVVPGLALARVA
jgi:conjugal transfer/entry exclusion protein